MKGSFNMDARRLSAICVGLATTLLSLASSADEADARHVGRAAVYGSLHDSSLEAVSTPQAILSVTADNAAPMEVWRVLEHGERVECLDCIPAVSKLLYEGHPKTREIAAWWLRRRVFGVFGPGEAYSQVVQTIQGDASEIRRARAAEALGEFLLGAGIKHVAQALTADGSPVVRESAARALERLNSEGDGGALAVGVQDPFVRVRLASIVAASRISTVSAGTVEAIVARIGDDDASVRRVAAEVLGTMRITDASVALAVLTDPEREPDAEVRKAAVASLGQLGDPATYDAVEAATADPDFLVRSVARIALRRL